MFRPKLFEDGMLKKSNPFEFAWSLSSWFGSAPLYADQTRILFAYSVNETV